MLKNADKAFTLAELLIALAILGIIATFTIPKVLQSQQDSRNKAMAKEVASMVSGALDAYKNKNTFSGNTELDHITPYMNFVKVDTSSMIDDAPAYTYVDCSAGNWSCLKMHSGGVLWYWGACDFGSTATTSAIMWSFDPDGKYTNTSSGKSVQFYLYANGRLTTHGNLIPGTWYCGAPDAADPSFDPAWFNWN
jgi:prepilin-type N-terminal cleavage/methylation domain-containing protein